MNKQEFDPVNILEAAGVDDFRIDYQSKTVFLPQVKLLKLARQLDAEIVSAYFFDHKDWIFVDELFCGEEARLYGLSPA
ncbi:MAG: hypothetical protein HPY90_14540 [Syntrophothermus sp.]|uniref:hypothetical protein n=1 Tax=Syntrophothermus sp. TaxID=2736299 RepID=UPI00257FC402|nr:hypothetical protein [Syntrophothermus sp.]NSW84450.1 hypothetical protein [Syntrophothermus sp.]